MTFKETEFPTPLKVIENSLESCQNLMDEKDSSGSTALIVVLTEEKIYVSWVGDSTCWNFWKNSLDLITEPHKPSNVTERYLVLKFLEIKIFKVTNRKRRGCNNGTK